MKSGICPKCHAHEIYVDTNLTVKGATFNLFIGFLARPARLDNYVCVRCGYVEQYVQEQEKLQIIAQKWVKVPDNAN